MKTFHPLSAKRERVRRVAMGETINGVYRLPPGEALSAFRADLLALLDDYGK